MALPGRVGLIGTAARAGEGKRAHRPASRWARVPCDRATQPLLQVHEVLEELVGGRDDLGVGLETTLGDDQVGELAAEVDVRPLERSAGSVPRPPDAGDADLGDAGVGRRA